MVVTDIRAKYLLLFDYYEWLRKNNVPRWWRRIVEAEEVIVFERDFKTKVGQKLFEQFLKERVEREP